MKIRALTAIAAGTLALTACGAAGGIDPTADTTPPATNTTPPPPVMDTEAPPAIPDTSEPAIPEQFQTLGTNDNLTDTDRAYLRDLVTAGYTGSNVAALVIAQADLICEGFDLSLSRTEQMQSLQQPGVIPRNNAAALVVAATYNYCPEYIPQLTE